jgi:hypothetical protein
MLDELLTQWKTERTPDPESFASPEYFENRFFAKIRAEKAKHVRKKTTEKLAEQTLKVYMHDIGSMVNHSLIPMLITH